MRMILRCIEANRVKSSWTILDTLVHIELQLYEKLPLLDQEM